jgi:nitrogenase-stabilizing/protective protein
MGDTTMNNRELEREMEGLESAEEFLDHFGIDYDPAVVRVNRLHILQRFHDYLEQIEIEPSSAEQQRELLAERLLQAYTDFTLSDARSEKVFRVFRMREPVQIEIPVTDLTSRVVAHASEV